MCLILHISSTQNEILESQGNDSYYISTSITVNYTLVFSNRRYMGNDEIHFKTILGF